MPSNPKISPYETKEFVIVITRKLTKFIEEREQLNGVIEK